MFSLDFIFISLTLIILLAVSIKIGSPKVAIPLILIYFFLILKNLLNFNNEENPKLVSEENLYSNQIQKDAEVNSKNQVLNQSDTVFKVQGIQGNSKGLENKKPPIKKKQKNKEEKRKQKIEKKAQVKIPNAVSKIKDSKKKETFNNLISIKEIKICKNIKNRNPVGIGDIFPNSVDSLYCFTKIENLGKKMEVRHVWYYENQIMTQVRYNVKKSNIYRSWTKKTISSFQVGNWRVEVQDRNGTIIGSKSFKIKKPS